MKQIPLTQGKIALVDDADFDCLNQYKWFAIKARGTFYAVRNITIPGIGQRQVRMHREILGLDDPNLDVDHKSGLGTDNQRQNIRVATGTQNNANSRKQTGRSSRFKGVSFHKRDQSWMAYIGRNKDRQHLGQFDDEATAARAYDKAAIERFGEFARLNFPL